MTGLRTGILAFLFATAASAASPSLPAQIEIVTEEVPPYSFTQNGKVTGVATEIVQAVLDRLNIHGHFTSLPWARAMRIARSQPNVLIYSIVRNDERETLFKWVGQLTSDKNYLFCLAGHDIKLNSLDEAKSYVTGTVIRDYHEDFLVKHGFGQGGNFESATGNDLNYSKLKAGRIDLWFTDAGIMAYVVRMAGDNPKTAVKAALEVEDPDGIVGNMAFGTKTDDAVVEAFRRALDSIKADGTFAKIVQKWS